MTTNEEILWLEERLRAMNPTINLNEGSPANTQVIEPFRRRFQPDPLESKITPFILGRLRQEFPDLTAEEGDAFTDLLVKPLSIMLEPFRREIRAIRRNQSISDPTTINSDEADRILANSFFSRSPGAFSRGVVRVYFANPVTLTVGSSNVAFTADGKRFRLSSIQSITSEEMLLNTDGTNYYWDLSYVAEIAGESYDIGPGDIIGVTGLAAATKATNRFRFRGGVTEQSTAQIISIAEESIGERSLNTVPGSVAKLFDEFADLRILQIIGFNDQEMVRDVITGGSLGDILMYWTDGLAPDDGDGYASTFSSANVASGGAPTYKTFTTYFGPAGTDIGDYVLTVWQTVGGVLAPADYRLGEVLGAGSVSIHNSYTNAARIPAIAAGTYWTIRKREILLSDVPGGILFPDVNGNQLSVEPDQIHVGGCSDYYVGSQLLSEKSMALTLLQDRSPVIKGLFVDTFGTSSADEVHVTMSEDEYDEVTSGEAMLRIIDTASGNNIGTYRIVHKIRYHAASGQGEFIINQDLIGPDETGNYGEIVDDIDVELLNPYEVIVEGEDLQTFAGLAVVSTVAGTIFTDYGLSVGPGSPYKLIILEGNDAGEYDVATIAAANLTLASVLGDTNGPLSYKLVNYYSDALDLPLWRIREIEQLDANSEPTGSVIPYRHPVDARSRRFANVGRAPKAGEGTTTDDTITMLAGGNIITSSDLTMNYWNKGVRLYDSVNIEEGDNAGYYYVTGVGGGPAPIGTGLASNALKLNAAVRWNAASIQYRVGAPSIGSFRMYFLNPCSATVSPDSTRLEVPSGGTTRGFIPDPSMEHQYLPSETTIPTARIVAGSTDIVLYPPSGASVLRAWNYDIQVGDYAEITYAPLVGSADLTAPVAALDGKSILVDLGDGNERVTFDATGTLTGAEIVSQINTQLSESVASLYTSGGASYLMLRADQTITLRNNSVGAPGAGDCTADLFDGAVPNPRTVWMPWLSGAFVAQDTTNASHAKGKWEIDSVNAVIASERGTLELGEDDNGNAYLSLATTTISSNDLGHYVRITRPGMQHISAVEMEDNVDELGLYYWDVECISEGHGDSWNIEPDLLATVTGYSSDGWEISVEDNSFSYSMAEKPWIHISPRVLLSGDDDPANFTTLMGDSVQITYEQDEIVESVHSFIRSPSERTLNNNPLARGLTPTFVRTNITYTGGYTESAAREAMASHIKDIMPNRRLEASDLVQILTDSGAGFVALPLTLIGISHGVNRVITVERSEDYISSDRLSVLTPDDDGTTTAGNSYLALNRV